MTLLGIVFFVFLLQFEACLSVSYFQRVGLDAILDCENSAKSDPTCINVLWLYNRDNTRTDTVSDGTNVQGIFEQSKRFNVNNSCSLVIKNLTAEDFGLYTCRIRNYPPSDIPLYLNILTISTHTPNLEGGIEVHCSLNRYSVSGSCDSTSIRWKDEKGNVLLDDGEDYKVQSQRGCTSYLIWTRPGDSSRRFTCQCVEDNEVKVEASYPPVLSGGPGDKKDKNSDSDPVLRQHIIIGSAVAVMMVLLISGVAFIKYKNRGNVTEGVHKPISQQLDEADSGVIYLAINHAVNQSTSSFSEVETEEVTYSGVKTEATEDLSSIYSNVNKLK